MASNDIVSTVRSIDVRLGKVEQLVYGDEQQRRPGILDEIEALTIALADYSEAVRRQTWVLWWVVTLQVIVTIVVALAVFL